MTTDRQDTLAQVFYWGGGSPPRSPGSTPMILTHVRLRDITGRLQKRTAHSVIEDNDKPTSQASR